MDTDARLARRLSKIGTRLSAIERSAQSANRSVESGTIEINDAEGNTIAEVGQLTDGSFGAVDLVPIVPAMPTAPDAAAMATSISTTWDGGYVEDQPLGVTVAYVGVHLNQDPDDLLWVPRVETEVGQITPGGGSVVLPGDAGVETAVSLVAVSASGVWSAPTDPVLVTPKYLFDSTLLDAALAGLVADLAALQDALDANALDLTAAQGAIVAAQSDITTLNTNLTTLDGIVGTNTAAITTLQGDLTTLDGTLAGLASDLAAAQIQLDDILPITETKISDDAITTPKIAANAVTASEIAAGAVTALKIAANTITAAQIAADTITATEIATGAITANEIAAGAVTAAKIAAHTITANEIAADTITANEIAADAITATELAAGSVIAAKIGAGQVTAGKIAADAVTANEIAAGAVTASEIAAGAVTTAKLDAGAVTANEIAAGAVTAAKIAATAIDGKTITGAILQSDAAANTGVKINTAGVNSYSSDALQVGVLTPAALLATPYGVTVDATGNVYIASLIHSTGLGLVRKYNSNGGVVLQFTCGANPLYGIAVDAAGFIYVTDGVVIRKFTSAGVEVVTGGFPCTTPGALSYGLVVDSSGNLYAVDTTNNRIRKFTSAGVEVVTGGFPVNTTGVPSGLARDPAGNLFVGDVTNSRIRKFSSAGVEVVTGGFPIVSPAEPRQVTVDTGGQIFVAHKTSYLVRIYSAVGATVANISLTTGYEPTGIALDTLTASVYVTDFTDRVVRKFNIPGNAITSATLGAATGKLYATDATIAGRLLVDSIRPRGFALTLTGIAVPVNDTDAATKEYVDSKSPIARIVASGAFGNTNASGYLTVTVSPALPVMPVGFQVTPNASNYIASVDLPNSTTSSLRIYFRNVAAGGAVVASANPGAFMWVAFF